MPHIVLTGPIGAGKSSVAAIVGKRLGRPVIELDEIRADFYATLGYDDDEAMEVARREGVPALLAYWKPYEIALVEHVANTPGDAVLDFGAGYSHYEDALHVQRASVALSPHYVVLLLPSDDAEEARRILEERYPEEYADSIRQANETLLGSRSTRDLADRVVITGTRTPDDIASDVIGGLPG